MALLPSIPVDLAKHAAYKTAVGHRLLAAIAELAGLVGWLCHDSNMPGPAQRYLTYGLQAARESADPRAAILKDKPAAAFVFQVDRACTLHPDITARVQWQFDKFKLARLYVSHAGRELARIRGSLDKIYSRAGAAGVQFRLSEHAESRQADEINNWNTAMYQAMASSSWFCGGGFALTG